MEGAVGVSELSAADQAAVRETQRPEKAAKAEAKQRAREAKREQAGSASRDTVESYLTLVQALPSATRKLVVADDVQRFGFVPPTPLELSQRRLAFACRYIRSSVCLDLDVCRGREWKG